MRAIYAVAELLVKLHNGARSNIFLLDLRQMLQDTN